MYVLSSFIRDALYCVYFGNSSKRSLYSVLTFVIRVVALIYFVTLCFVIINCYVVSVYYMMYDIVQHIYF